MNTICAHLSITVHTFRWAIPVKILLITLTEIGGIEMALPKTDSGFNDFSRSADPSPKGGGDEMALAVTSAIASQATALAQVAQAAQLSVDAASEQLSTYFAHTLSGQALIEATLAKTAAKIEARGGMLNVSTHAPVVTIDLPKMNDFSGTRQRFMGLFGGSADVNPAFILEPTND